MRLKNEAGDSIKYNYDVYCEEFTHGQDVGTMIQSHLQLCLEKLKGVQQAKAKNRIGLPSEKHVCKMGTKNFFLSLRVS